MGLARYDERLAAIAETLSTGMDLVEEAAQDVMRYVDRNDLDEEHFEKVDRRVSAYYELSRKFRCEPETLFVRLENARSELKNLTSSKDVKALERAEKKALETYHARAAELTKRREDAGKRLANAVTEEMQTLAMKGARMETALIPNQPLANGSEHCEFLIAGHAGVQTRSLQKVASGGELARISLAIAVITAKITPVPTLILTKWTAASAAPRPRLWGDCFVSWVATAKSCASRTFRRWPLAGIIIGAWKRRSGTEKRRVTCASSRPTTAWRKWRECWPAFPLRTAPSRSRGKCSRNRPNNGAQTAQRRPSSPSTVSTEGHPSFSLPKTTALGFQGLVRVMSVTPMSVIAAPNRGRDVTHP